MSHTRSINNIKVKYIISYASASSFIIQTMLKSILKMLLWGENIIFSINFLSCKFVQPCFVFCCCWWWRWWTVFVNCLADKITLRLLSTEAEVALHRGLYEKEFWKYATNLQENIHAKGNFSKVAKSTCRAAPTEVIAKTSHHCKPPKAASRDSKRRWKNVFVNISHRKAPIFKSPTLLKRYSNAGFFLWNGEIFKNNYFEEHLRKIASEPQATKDKTKAILINPFVSNAPFLYPLKT